MKKLTVIAGLAALSAVMGYRWLAARSASDTRQPAEASESPASGDDAAPSPVSAPGARESTTTLKAPAVRNRALAEVSPSGRSKFRSGPLSGTAADLKARGKALKAQRADTLGLSKNPISRESLLSTNRGVYAAVSGFWAVPEKNFSGAGTVVRRGLGFVFLKLENDAAPPEGARPAVYNPASKSYGILSGGLIIQLRPGADALSLTKDYPVSLVPQSEDKITFYRANASGNDNASPRAEELSQLVQQLKSDVRVTNASLEVIEQGFEPK